MSSKRKDLAAGGDDQSVPKKPRTAGNFFRSLFQGEEIQCVRVEVDGVPQDVPLEQADDFLMQKTGGNPPAPPAPAPVGAGAGASGGNDNGPPATLRIRKTTPAPSVVTVSGGGPPPPPPGANLVRACSGGNGKKPSKKSVGPSRPSRTPATPRPPPVPIGIPGIPSLSRLPTPWFMNINYGMATLPSYPGSTPATPISLSRYLDQHIREERLFVRFFIGVLLLLLPCIKDLLVYLIITFFGLSSSSFWDILACLLIQTGVELLIMYILKISIDPRDDQDLLLDAGNDLATRDLKSYINIFMCLVTLLACWIYGVTPVRCAVRGNIRNTYLFDSILASNSSAQSADWFYVDFPAYTSFSYWVVTWVLATCAILNYFKRCDVCWYMIPYIMLLRSNQEAIQRPVHVHYHGYQFVDLSTKNVYYLTTKFCIVYWLIFGMLYPVFWVLKTLFWIVFSRLTLGMVVFGLLGVYRYRARLFV